jgi:hypothetical protein
VFAFDLSWVRKKTKAMEEIKQKKKSKTRATKPQSIATIELFSKLSKALQKQNKEKPLPKPLKQIN